MNWTPEQETAIKTRGSDILVSAAAGSGKTAVLVERIIRQLLDDENPLNIDEILVVTFTNAAAQEMKNRIGRALEEALAKHPHSKHLKKQLSLLPRAQISTLHAFYTKVVRQYAYLFDLDPSFTIADEMEIELIKQDVIDELFEMYYHKKDDELERFFSVVDRYSSDRSDEAVEMLILDLYEFAMQDPKPEKWLDALLETYNVSKDTDERSLTWLNILKEEIHDELQACKKNLEQALKIAMESDGPYHYSEALESDLKAVYEAMDYINDWEQLGAVFLNFKRKRLSSKSCDCDPEKQELVKKLRGNYTKIWDDIKKNYFRRHLMAHLQDMEELYPVVEMIIELVKQFKKLLTKAKRERAVVDFLDLEHLCLSVFTDEEKSTEKFVPSEIARSYQKQFKEILIDEYQDINSVQEIILSLISDQTGPGNRFMVGDVKQSIYRFRHAEPTLFIDKYERFSNVSSTGKRIDLTKNFRSRKNILKSTNYIFKQIMDPYLGEVIYDEKAMLVYGNDSYDNFKFNNEASELILVDESVTSLKEMDGDKEIKHIEKARLEARAIVKKINKWLGDLDGQRLQIIDDETGRQRDIQFKDIAILYRSLTEAHMIVEELKSANIPVYAKLREGYFAAIEIQVMISLLKIIDNPYQDIPLASVLRSPIVQLNEDELMNIRLVEKRKSLFDAVIKYERQKNDELKKKLTRFLNLLKLFRDEAKTEALSELIWFIYNETGYYDYVGGMPGGRQRQANLRALYDRARYYESTSFRGLFRFLRFIEQMEEEGKDLGVARALSEEEDVVRLMTIHESKGLEFPIVIIGGLNQEFYTQDLHGKYLLEKDFGFATKYIDPTEQIHYPTLFYHALKKEIERKRKSEEMRVLYVALTRAKEKLVMLGTVNSIDRLKEKWQLINDETKWLLPNHIRINAKSFLDWIGPSLFRHRANKTLRLKELNEKDLNDIHRDDSVWDVSIYYANELIIDDKKEAQLNKKLLYSIKNWEKIDVLEDEKLKEVVERRLNFKYPFEKAAKTRAKQSVTEIKNIKQFKDEYSDDRFIRPFIPPITKRPLFMQSETKLSATEQGTAMHTVMQHLPLSKTLKFKDIELWIERFIERDILRIEEAEAINIQSIEQFFQTNLAHRMKYSTYLEKEVPFTYMMDAHEIYDEWENKTDEKVLIQGVIDVLFKDEFGWTIVDYKTDEINEQEVTDRVKEKLKRRYLTQIDLYKKAIQSIIKERVDHTYLYFFNKQLTIEI